MMVIDDVTRNRIIENIREAMKSQGYGLDVTWGVTEYFRDFATAMPQEFLRRSAALHQSGTRGVLEVPDVPQATRAKDMLNQLNIHNIDVSIVPHNES